jgi:hypothetical protein
MVIGHLEVSLGLMTHQGIERKKMGKKVGVPDLWESGCPRSIPDPFVLQRSGCPGMCWR